MATTAHSEALRLEELWGKDFGDAYVERNRLAGDLRGPFWNTILNEFPASKVLEVGCNLGGNLRWVGRHASAPRAYGVDVNAQALRELHKTIPDVNAVYSPARDLPFRDRAFGLVFTMGVLIHQPDSTLPLVMAEVVRTSNRFVLCGEYHSEATVEVPYRGEKGALFKRDYGRIYRELFPELELRKEGKLNTEDGFDDVTYWVFEKR